jgi:ubiquinone/menaquinone biosynthesis C-methylase UbiE
MGYALLTPLYDYILVPGREKAWKGHLVNNLVSKIIPNKHISVLDVACGTGTLMSMLYHQSVNTTSTLSIVGVDIDPDILQRAEQKLKNDQVPDSVWNLQKSSCTALDFSDATFDHAMTSLLLHHLTADAKRDTLAHMYRVLKPGGVVHIADFMEPSNSFMRLLFYSIQLLDGFETTSDNVNGLLPGMIAGAGFKNVVLERSFDTMVGTIGIYTAIRSE